MENLSNNLKGITVISESRPIREKFEKDYLDFVKQYIIEYEAVIRTLEDKYNIPRIVMTIYNQFNVCHALSTQTLFSVKTNTEQEDIVKRSFIENNDEPFDKNQCIYKRAYHGSDHAIFVGNHIHRMEETDDLKLNVRPVLAYYNEKIGIGCCGTTLCDPLCLCVGCCL
jgi:hypothetical protein